MVIEWLKFRVPLDQQTEFIRLDAQIWSSALARNPGYLGKAVWCEHETPESLNLIIRWSDRASWKAVPVDLLAATDLAFNAALGQSFPVLQCIDYDVVEES